METLDKFYFLTYKNNKTIFYCHKQGWPEKDQSGFNHLVLTGLNHLKKPNFDHHKWSKLKNQDFSEVNINKSWTKKEININVLCWYVYVI